MRRIEWKALVAVATLVPAVLVAGVTPASATHDPTGSCRNATLRELYQTAGTDFLLCHQTQAGDFVSMNGPGRLRVVAPDGQVFYETDPPGCCARTAVSSGIVAHGVWRVYSDVTCCGGRPRYFWTIAGWTGTTDFVCNDGESAHIELDYDNRSWHLANCW